MNQENPDPDDVETLLEKYTENFQIHHPLAWAVKVQFNEHPDELNEIVGDLIDEGYTIEVDQQFELPPTLTVREQVIDPQ